MSMSLKCEPSSEPVSAVCVALLRVGSHAKHVVAANFSRGSHFAAKLFAHRSVEMVACPISSQPGRYQTVQARFWPWPSRTGSHNLFSYSLFARRRLSFLRSLDGVSLLDLGRCCLYHGLKSPLPDTPNLSHGKCSCSRSAKVDSRTNPSTCPLFSLI
jgi:hypothetical protein